MKSAFITAIALCASWAYAQTETITNAAGNTVVEVVTLNPAGLPTTQILQTIIGTALTTALTTNTLSTTSTTSTTTTNPILQTIATTSTTKGQQGPVEQPASTTVLVPGGPTPYTYTTTNAAGSTVAVLATFTPTGPATVLPATTTTGVIVNYSSYIASVGTSAAPTSGASRQFLLSSGCPLDVVVLVSLWTNCGSFKSLGSKALQQRLPLVLMSTQSQSQSQQQQPHVQAQLDAGQEVLAVACVVDASLSLATEWTRVVTGYILPILKRLNEVYNGHQFRLALVTYGAPDTRPNPLLSKRFFFPPTSVMKELREDPSKLGIGSAIGVRGLSALEGMVAAIEFFDILHNSLAAAGPKDTRIPVSHILHIAASPPDSTRRPLWNTLPHLDSVSWDTLPLELKKRKINLSLITLRQIQQFQDVQSATSAPAPQTAPWFTVHTPHILRLSGFPPQAHVQTPKLSELPRTTSLPLPRSPIPDAARRPNESPQTPDTKRQKLSEKSSPALSPRLPGGGAGPVGQRPPSTQVPAPSIQHSAQPSQTHSQMLLPSPIPPHATITSTPSPAKPPAAPATHPPTNAPNPNAPPTQYSFPPNISIFIDRLKGIEVDMKTLDAKLQEAQSAGNTADVELLQKERVMMYNTAIKLKTVVMQHATKASRAAMNGSNSGAGGSGEMSQPPPPPQPQPQPQPAANNSMSEDAAPLTVPAPISTPAEEQKPLLTDQQALMHFMQTRSGPGGFPSPEVAAQMQKLINKTGIQPPTFSGSPKPRPALPPASGSTTQLQPQPQASTSTSSGGSKQWEGSITFTALHAGQPKGLETQVAVTQSTGDLHTDTWPDKLFISVSKEALKDHTELQAWLRKHQHSVAMVQFKPQARSMDQNMNAMVHGVLLKMMAERRTFAVAAWQLPGNSGNTNNMIVFPMGNVLAGAVFPLTGLPDLPTSGKVDVLKPQLQPQSQPQPQLQPQPGTFSHNQLQGLDHKVQTQLQGLDPQQQIRFLQQFARQQQMRQRQQQQQTGAPQQEAPAPAPGPGPGVGMQNMSPFSSNAANQPMNMFGGGGVHQRQFNGGMHPGGTVNFEMMQSFIQRSADGSNRQGMNPS
ncbi:uncharacterized protein EDB91DRAFT_1254405 [Suillus paluster]|uniref:uncharacterized protein n=1 Tax=Suillus paluster TaxID=48578 RepID=UPI001B85D377|nr:uncharacterized protein EDB91DRAFT_1254405 [Suillus paluster]KAG1726263.1 hypothetical protein EDB91DRAFT_1254405 [Suillus paluster]